MSAEQCDADVWKEGVHIATCTWPKECIEALCVMLASKSGAKVDWSYFGGHGAIQAIASPEQMKRLKHEIEMAMGTLRLVQP